jgi:hypothetical protein
MIFYDRTSKLQDELVEAGVGFKLMRNSISSSAHEIIHEAHLNGRMWPW